MKTIEEIKDNRARDEGYKDWKDLEWNASENCVASLIDELMREYAEQYRRLAKDAAFELGNANIRILKLEEYNLELENTLGLRNRSNPDLTIDEEKPKSLFERWQNLED